MMTDGRFSVLRDVLFPPLRLFCSVSERFWGVKVIYRRDAESKSEVKGEWNGKEGIKSKREKEKMEIMSTILF